MDAPYNTSYSEVFFPTSLPEIFTIWEKHTDAVPFAGGTEMLRLQGNRVPKLPPLIICLDKIPELKRVTRTERYIEIGAMVTLNGILSLGKAVPEVFARCLEAIACPQVRNIATIGGNICRRDVLLDTGAPLIGLEALYELRGAYSSRWISASRFVPMPGAIALSSRELLTRIRVPLDHWDYSAYKKFTRRETGGAMNDGVTGGAVFLIRNEKNTLAALRILFTGDIILRDKNSESLLVGKRLPLDKRERILFMDQWERYLLSVGNTAPLFRSTLLQFIESNLDVLRE